MAPPGSLSLDTFLWLPGTFPHRLFKYLSHLPVDTRAACLFGMLWGVPFWGRKKKMYHLQWGHTKGGNWEKSFLYSIYLLYIWEAGFLPSRFTEIRWISQPIKVLIFNSWSCYICSIHRGRQEAFRSGLPGGSVVKNPPANAGDMGSIPGSERSPGGKNSNPLQ